MKLAMSKRAIFILVLICCLAGSTGEPGVIQIGSKSDPDAPLFSYDEKFHESTYHENFLVGMSASKDFDECTRLSSNTYLRSYPNWTEIVIGSSFEGIGRAGYLVLDPETMEVKEEMSRITHLFIGNFTMDEHIQVIKDHMNETGYLGCI
jgi:hypothetical protein